MLGVGEGARGSCGGKQVPRFVFIYLGFLTCGVTYTERFLQLGRKHALNGMSSVPSNGRGLQVLYKGIQGVSAFKSFVDPSFQETSMEACTEWSEHWNFDGLRRLFRLIE